MMHLKLESKELLGRQMNLNFMTSFIIKIVIVIDDGLLLHKIHLKKKEKLHFF